MRNLKHIVLFLLLFKVIDLLLAYTLDYFHENTLYGENGGNLNAYLKQKSCDTLFLGASRFQNGVNPLPFGDEAYTLSNQQMHILFQTATLDILAKKHKLPTKLLVLHLEVEDFSAAQDSSNQEDIHFLKYHYRSNSFIRQEIQRSSATAFLKYYADSYRHNKNVISLISNYFQRRNESIGVKGFYGLPQRKSDFDTLNPNLLPKHPKRYEASPLSKRCIAHIKKICAENRLKLVVVTAPIYKTDVAYQQLAEQLTQYLKSQKIQYLNYNSPNLKPHFPYALWYDLKHLNKEGASAFTARLKTDLNAAIKSKPHE